MSERKVLNKYYPPDFDPRKLPKLKLSRDRQFVIRIMAPMSIKCNNCGEYIYKGKKFNARQETVKNETYLGLRIYRFYIKCPRCMSEITFKTDPKNADYTMEHGGKRCFDAAKLAARAKEKELEELEEQEQSNPMLALEKRTYESKIEMESLEKLEELKELSKKHANVNYEQLLDIHTNKIDEDKLDLLLEEKRDEQLTKEIFKNKVVKSEDIGEKFNFSNLFKPKLDNNKANAEKVTLSSKVPQVIIRKRQIDSNLLFSEKNQVNDHSNPNNDTKLTSPKKPVGLVHYGSSENDSDT